MDQKPKTKIVCTLEPASRSVPMVEKLLLAEMNVARFNFSHGSHEYHQETLNNLRAAMDSPEFSAPLCSIPKSLLPRDPSYALEGEKSKGNNQLSFMRVGATWQNISGKGPPANGSVYVCNLPEGTDENMLAEYFGTIGLLKEQEHLNCSFPDFQYCISYSSFYQVCVWVLIP